MRLGKDVLEVDLYRVLGVLPDATESEIRVAYRRLVRTSHPDLNQEDPEAAARMTRLNVAARVLLDSATRRAYDRTPRRGRRPSAAPKSAQKAAWFERREQNDDDQWVESPPPAREQRAGFPAFFSELRSRDGQLGLQVHELVESLSVRQQLGVAAFFCAIAVYLIAWAQPSNLSATSSEPASLSASGVYP